MRAEDVRYFRSGADFRRWLEKHHASVTAQWVAIAKKDATDRLLRYPDALDAALAYGWIDGFVSKLDDSHYALRFTPRKPRSNWSAVNLKRYGELLAAGRIEAPGRLAFESRDRAVSEEARAALSGPLLATLKRNADAWAFFSAQPPGYRRQASWSVLSARTEATRERRLQALIAASARGERIGQAVKPVPKTAKASGKAVAKNAPAKSAAGPLATTARTPRRVVRTPRKAG